MRTDRRWAWLGAGMALTGVMALTVAAAGWSALAAAPQEAEAKNQEPDRPAQGKRLRPPPVERPGSEASKEDEESGGLRLPLADRPEALPKAEPDPLAPPIDADAAAEPEVDRQAAQAPVIPQWPFYYVFQLVSFDGLPLTARYYPSQLGDSAAPILLVHEPGPGRSGQDFEEPIAELENQSLAAYLQEMGYAVLIVDLRGHGANRGRRGARWDPRRAVGDLQAAYRFLIDRHNRRELNLAKLAAIGLGASANLVAEWAASPAGAVSIEGRASDLAALALISPEPQLAERRIAPAIARLSARMPVLILAGRDDDKAIDVINAVRVAIEGQRHSKIELINTRLSGYNLLRFAPGATQPLLTFLDTTVKIRADEWEPRYNLDPVAFADVRLVNIGESEDEGEAAEANDDRRERAPNQRRDRDQESDENR